MMIRIAVLSDYDSSIFRKGIAEYSQSHGAQIESRIFEADENFLSTKDSFLSKISSNSLWDLIIIAVTGAKGMEAVLSAREIAKSTPLIWCSDDREFAVASYRLRCDLFLPLPLEINDVTSGIERCLKVS